jgi:hypothetical protein
MRKFYLLAASFCLFLISSISYSQVAKTTQAGLIESGFGINPNLTGATGIAIRGNYAYVVGIGDVLQILDITLPGLPLPKGSLANGVGGAIIKRPQHIAVQGNYAYITNSGGSALEIVDISDPAHPVHKSVIEDGKGSAPYLFNSWGLAVSGNYAYVTIDNGLEIIDISNPAAPAHKGVIFHNDGVNPPYLQQAVSINLVGNLAYVGCLGALQIIDVSDPAAPVARGMLLDQGHVDNNPPYIISPYTIAISGNYAYVPDNSKPAVEIIDISNPDAPVHANTILNGPNPTVGPNLLGIFSVAVAGNYLYVAGSNKFFDVIDITNPMAPVRTGGFPQLDAVTYAREIVIVGKYAYLPSRSTNGFTIIDISNPPVPKLKGNISNGSGGALFNSATSVFVNGNYAYVGNYGQSSLPSGFEIINISDPSVPLHAGSVLATSLNFAGRRITSVVVDKNTAFLTNRDGALVMVDVTNPLSPSESKVLKDPAISPGSPYKLAKAAGVKLGSNGAYAFVASEGSNGIEVVDVIDRSNPAHKAFLADGNGFAPYLNRPVAIDIRGPGLQTAFIASYASNALEIISASPSPSHRGALLDGNGNTPYLKKPKSVFLKDNLVYVASYGSSALEIVDVTNPSAPIHKGAFKDPILDSVNYVHVAGNYAYLTCGQTNSAGTGLPVNGRLVVVDITNPANPTLYQVFKDGTNGALLDYPTSVYVSGGYGYVTNAGLFENLNVVYLYGPGITDFTPTSAPAGATVTINGQNFNTFITASVNGTQGNVTEVTENTLLFTVPEAATNGKITLGYAGQNFVTQTNFIVTPTASSATSLQQNGFTVNWSNVGAAKYFLDVSTDNFATFVGTYNNLALGSANSISIADLSPATAYQYRVRSSDGTLISGNSNVVTATTIPATPVANETTLVNQNGFTANWTAIAGAGNYFLDVATDAAFSRFVLGYNNATISSSETSQIVSGLTSFSTFYYRVRAANTAGSSPSSNVINVVTLDITAPSIADAIAPNATTISVGANPVLNITITDNVAVASATLNYRGISGKTFNTAALQGPGGLSGNYSITIQSDWYDSLGMEYYFSAADESENKTETVTKYIQLITPSITLPALPSGDETTDYRIVAFPYEMSGGNAITTVYSNVPWNDNTKAGVWWWNPASKSGTGDYETYNEGAKIERGKGYWMITRSPVSPTLSNVPAPKYNQGNLHPMTLEPGWNEVGNPYPVSISWDDVIAYNVAINPALVITRLNIFGKTGFALAKDGVLPSFQGGFVNNSGSSAVTIQVPFAGQSDGARKAAVSSNISDDNWNVFFHIVQDDRTNTLGGFGMNRNANAGADRFDNFNPPAIFEYPQVDLTNSEYPKIRFSNNIVQLQNEYTWTVTPSGSIGKSAQLMWNAETSNTSKQLFLLDEENLNVIDMQSTSQYDFVLTATSRFRIFFGENVEKNIITEKITATVPYPNPINSENKMTMKLSLPDDHSEAKVNIYNLQGVMIGTLNKQFNAGIYSLDVNLPENLSPGIYIYRLAIANGKETSLHTGKIVKP